MVGWDKETDEEETQNIEKGNSPEDLLDRTWEGLDWVLGLSSGETDKLSSRERESSSDENSAESFESVLESTRIVPCAGTPVFAVFTPGWPTSKNEDEGSDHEDNYLAG